MTDIAAGGLSHLVEAASTLAKLTTQSHESSGPHSSASPERGVVSDEEHEGKKLCQQSDDSPASRSKREIFPERLMAMLDDESLTDVITWLPHGRSFVIIRPDVFTEKVLPKYLPPIDTRVATKYPSFTRKLNRWGFRQATRGPDTGAFHHPLFRRDQRELCVDMVCQRTRDRKPEKKPSNLPPKKRPQPSSATTSKVSSLTKEALDAISPSETAPPTPARATVSEDSRSEASNPESSNNGASFPVIPKGITSDKEFVARTMKQRDEVERMNLAKVMLFDAYMKAVKG